jgi:hypothetical protein
MTKFYETYEYNIAIHTDYEKTIEICFRHLDISQPNNIIEKIKYKKLFIGKNNPKLKTSITNEPRIGNSILAKIEKNKYVFIGHTIIYFEIPYDDTIIFYESPVGRSYVPMPWAIGKKYTYLMEEKAYISNEELGEEFKDDPFGYYYNAGDKNFHDTKIIRE